jgi:hypothetical protein
MEISKANLAEVDARLKELANGRKSKGAGVLVYPIKGRTSTDYKKVIADNCSDVDLSKYQKIGAQTWAVK